MDARRHAAPAALVVVRAHRYSVDRILTEDFAHLEAHGVVEILPGRCKRGTPAMMISLKNMKPTLDVEECGRFLVYKIEDCLHRFAPVNYFTFVFNVTGSGRANINIALGKHLAPVLEDNYCERLARTLVFPSPWWLKMTWAVGRNFVDVSTAAKFQFLGSAKELLVRPSVRPVFSVLRSTFSVHNPRGGAGGGAVGADLSLVPADACLCHALSVTLTGVRLWQ